MIGIATVKTQEDRSFKVALDSGEVLSVPDDFGNRHRKMIKEWVDDGGVIAPYVVPPLPTDEERLDIAFSSSDKDQIIKAIFIEFENRISVLENGIAKSETELLESKLPKI